MKKLTDYYLMIDIGHATGTGAKANGADEHELCTELAGVISKGLANIGIRNKIVDFPDKSNAEDLALTIKEANSGGYTHGVSLHCDCSDNPNAKGGHVIYYKYSTYGKEWAEALSVPIGGSMPGRSEKLVGRTDLAVLKRTKPYWALVEFGFISNEEDLDKLNSKKDDLSTAFIDAIFSYFKKLQLLS